MIPLGQPRFQGTLYYRYENRNQRIDIQSLTKNIFYPHPDTTSVTIFPNPSCGIAKIEVSELVQKETGIEAEPDTPKVKKALAWLEKRLIAMGLNPVNPADVPPESESEDEFNPKLGHRNV